MCHLPDAESTDMIKALILPQGDFGPAQAIQLVIKLNQGILDGFILCVKRLEVFPGYMGLKEVRVISSIRRGSEKSF